MSPAEGREAERPLRVAVIGAGAASAREEELAMALGAALARAGAVVVCGGLGGVMEAVARGCAGEGGWTVGILPGPDSGRANDWIRLPIPTGMGEGRNVLVVRAAEAVVAVGGAWGTLSEIALAGKMGIPVATLGEPPVAGLQLPAPDSPEAAAEWAVVTARSRRVGTGTG